MGNRPPTAWPWKQTGVLAAFCAIESPLVQVWITRDLSDAEWNLCFCMVSGVILLLVLIVESTWWREDLAPSARPEA